MYLSDFQRYCDEHKVSSFVYNDNNNREYVPGYTRPRTICTPMCVNMTFNSVFVQLPGFIAFIGDFGNISFHSVERVNVDGKTATIYCKNAEQKVAYTILMQ